MKKIIVCLWAVFFCIAGSGILYAETVGNSSDIHLPPGKGVYSAQLGDFITLQMGLDAEFLVEKNFKHKNEGATDPSLKGVFYMSKMSCTLFERVQPYVTLGYSDLEMTWKSAGESASVEAGLAPAWGAGIKAYLWEFEGLGIKIFSTASFRSTKPKKFRHATIAGRQGIIADKKFHIFERQASLGLSKEFCVPGFEEVSIVPYMGGVWSQTSARVIFSKGGYLVNSGASGQENNIGLFFGTDFVFMDNLSLNIEGRIIDEKAVSLGFIALF